MNNKNVVERFVNKLPAKGEHLKSDGINLISYWTVIATHCCDGTILITNKKYSRTTSRHLTHLIRMCTNLRKEL